MNIDTTTPFNKDWLTNREVAKKQIKKLIREWKPVLDMSHWTIEVTFHKEEYAASCYAEPEYRNAHLNFYLGKLLPKFKINYELEEFVVHELIHCLSWPLVDITENLIEHTGDPTGELWKSKENNEELFVQRMSDALVMSKYNMKTIPDTVKVKGLERRRVKKH